MTSKDVFADEAEVQADLSLIENILWSRTVLSERLVAASASRDADHIDTSRIETMYQFAEFFFLLRARKIETLEGIKRFADIHNLHIDMLTRDPEKMRRLGLRRERLNDAVFTSDTLPRLIQNWEQRPGTMDQSNLARFLVTVMSTETCRKLVVASEEAGFLERSRSAYGTILVFSTGIMEQVFGTVVRDLRERLQNVNSYGSSHA